MNADSSLVCREAHANGWEMGPVGFGCPLKLIQESTHWMQKVWR
jgi:hypothetical protein